MQRTFDTREAASTAAAEQIATCLSTRLDRGETSLVVSGGTTPVRCFEALAETALRWKDVHVLLSDERWVPPDSDDSNEKLVREQLLTKSAAEAQLLPYFLADTDIAARCATLNEEISSLPMPFGCTLLGMGEDGHFASLFPDAANLQEGFETESQTLCLPVMTSASAHPRISLTLAALSCSDQVILLIFGEEKRAVLTAAMQPGSDLPVSRLLQQKRAPVIVYWAP